MKTTVSIFIALLFVLVAVSASGEAKSKRNLGFVARHFSGKRCTMCVCPSGYPASGCCCPHTPSGQPYDGHCSACVCPSGYGTCCC